MKWTVILLPAVCAGLYLLYVNGYMVTQVKKAVKYIETNKGTKASFAYCTGFTKRRVSFAENKSYHFVFTPELSRGEVSAELLDENKNIILSLSDIARAADLKLEQKGKYYLVFRFKSASGKYTLNWE